MSETEQTTGTVPTETAERAPRRTAPAKRGSGMLWSIAAIIVLAAAAGGAYYFGVLPGGILGKSAPAEGPESLVATVNGVGITQSELDTKIEEVVAQYGMTPEQASDASFELQVLDEVINLRLLTSEAEKQGITVSDEDVATELVALVEKLGGQETFTTQLAAVGLTEDELRTNMRNELLIRKLLDANTDMENITVSDEEVAAMYDEAVGMAPEGQEMPPLAEVSEMARAQLIQQKSSEIVTAYVEQLRSGASIEIKL